MAKEIPYKIYLEETLFDLKLSREGFDDTIN